MNDQQKERVVSAVKAASNKWRVAFNSGDASECAAQYEGSAVMKAEPFGVFEGAENILAFWQKLIDDGFSDVEYVDPKIDVIDEQSAILSSAWKMNNAHGVIHRELWVVQSDGVAKLREDHFEAVG
ncbi:hypothetical protein MLD52_03755 [Puniceicoccaceae bacterium K14]|nr:hypothetical protein [Puniceicoccaceae bacterium K14]